MDLKQRRVSLCEDVHWPERFDAIEDELESHPTVDPLAVYHVGSTAIPEVPGKPAVDVIAIVEDETAIEAAATALVADAGFERPEEGSVVVRWHGDWAVFLKLHEPGDPKVAAQLTFREYLRADPEARARYVSAKREAAQAHPDDLAAYTEAKGAVVAELLETAREQGYDDRIPAPH